jgi:hypothetical protein
VPLIYDFDDAVQHVSPKYGRLGRLVSLVKCPQKTNELLAMAGHVVAGNRILAEYAGIYNPHVSLIPTVVDHKQITPGPPRPHHGPLVLGWMGTHTTAPYLEACLPILAELARRRDILVRAIGAGRPLGAPGLTVENREWSLDRELEELRGFDIGLYPLPDDEWTRGKSGFKAVQNMAVAVPTVAAPVGATADIIEDGVTGFLASTPQQWQEKLELLIDDAALRHSMGQAGRARVEEWYCVEKQAPRWAEVLGHPGGEK